MKGLILSLLILLNFCLCLSAQVILMGSLTPPLEPEKFSRLESWTDEEFYAYSLGVIEWAWAAAGQLAAQGKPLVAYQALQVLGAYWWQISRPQGIRGAMAFLRNIYKTYLLIRNRRLLIEALLSEARELTK